jgi:hypothetical protein
MPPVRTMSGGSKLSPIIRQNMPKAANAVARPIDT